MPKTKKEEKEEKLPFANAEITRLMKKHLNKDKFIRKQVKDEMNKLLGEILKDICLKLNEYPYAYLEYEMFKEVTKKYTNAERTAKERERIIKYLEVIKADCDVLITDIEERMKE